MARYNEILTGRFNRFAQKLLSMKGPASLVSLSDEAQAVVPLWNGVENRFLEQWYRYATNGFQGAVAAQNSAVRLRNPANSGVICVIESIMAYTTSAALTELALEEKASGNTDLAATANGVRLDPRQQGSSTAILSVGAGAAIGLGNQIEFGLSSGAASPLPTVQYIYTADQELAILPDQAYQVITGAVNSTVRVSYVWRERALEDSEKF